MKVILQQDVNKLGKKGAMVKVKDGFARNFLLPKGIALTATQENLKKVERNLANQAQRITEEKGKAQELADKLSAISCTISVDAHEEDKIYGSVTAAHILSALEAEGIILDKKQVLLKDPIKSLGIYDVELRLHPEVKAKLKVWVVKK